MPSDELSDSAQRTWDFSHPEAFKYYVQAGRFAARVEVGELYALNQNGLVDFHTLPRSGIVASIWPAC